jgi:hypothetical protein
MWHFYSAKATLFAIILASVNLVTFGQNDIILLTAANSSGNYVQIMEHLVETV